MSAGAPLNRDAPIPLGHFKAIDKAIELRNLGSTWSWPVISEVMKQYHGFKRSPGWWRKQLHGKCEARTRNPNLFQAKFLA